MHSVQGNRFVGRDDSAHKESAASLLQTQTSREQLPRRVSNVYRVLASTTGTWARGMSRYESTRVDQRRATGGSQGHWHVTVQLQMQRVPRLSQLLRYQSGQTEEIAVRAESAKLGSRKKN